MDNGAASDVLTIVEKITRMSKVRQQKPLAKGRKITEMAANENATKTSQRIFSSKWLYNSQKLIIVPTTYLKVTPEPRMHIPTNRRLFETFITVFFEIAELKNKFQQYRKDPALNQVQK